MRRIQKRLDIYPRIVTIYYKQYGLLFIAFLVVLYIVRYKQVDLVGTKLMLWLIATPVSQLCDVTSQCNLVRATPTVW